MNVPRVPLAEAAGLTCQDVRELLERSGFTAAAICRRLGLPRLSAIDAERVRARDSGELRSGADVLIRLFLEGWPVAGEAVDRWLGARGLLEGLRLIEPYGEDSFAATVTLYPVMDLFIASDRFNNVDGSKFVGWDDMVYQCLLPTTERLITGVPRTGFESVLDMCAGAGVGGLLCAKAAKRVLAVDLMERCVHFVRFNAALNGLTNVEARQGSLYEPVGDEQFDLITAHPPYQPVWRHLQTFNSGGMDGEQIAKGVIEGGPKHLKPGGRMYCLCQLSDRAEPAEVRVRGWLTAEEQAEVDIAVVSFRHRNLIEFTAVSALCENWQAEDWRAWMEQMQPLRIRDLVYGMYVLQRSAGGRKVFTVRREGPAAEAEAISGLVDWETRAAEAGFADGVRGLRLRLRKSCEMSVRMEAGGGTWKPGTAMLRNTLPFESALQVDERTMELLARMDGRKPLGELLQSVSMRAPVEKVAALVHLLVSKGFAEVVG
ncbi:MAG: methyltransferase [Acidobacteria bacterium]|nr:methyltransferase [Acidobacteriota bacterium]